MLAHLYSWPRDRSKCLSYLGLCNRFSLGFLPQPSGFFVDAPKLVPVRDSRVVNTGGSTFVATRGFQLTLLPGPERLKSPSPLLQATGKRPSIRAFPSPFRHSTTVELLNVDPLINYVVGVYDVAGRLVTKLPLSNGKTTWTGNNHPAGIYFLKLNADTDSPTTKLLKLQ